MKPTVAMLVCIPHAAWLPDLLPHVLLQRTVRVDDPEVGYRKKRVGEMDAGQPFDLKIEVLTVVKK